MSKIGAKIRLQTAFMLARDIRAYRAGDVSRFDRMVDARGKGLMKLDDAIKNVVDLCGAVASCYPMTSRILQEWVLK
jgi:hypothetical protein